MAKRGARNTRRKIVKAAWRLFYEQGYDNTTVEEIIQESGTSKGSFYHYFSGKDALLSSLSSVFDEKYEELRGVIAQEDNCFDKLLYLNRELFSLIESTVSVELMSRMFATQLTTSGARHLMTRAAPITSCCAPSPPRDRPRGRFPPPSPPPRSAASLPCASAA